MAGRADMIPFLDRSPFVARYEQGVVVHNGIELVKLTGTPHDPSHPDHVFDGSVVSCGLTEDVAVVLFYEAVYEAVRKRRSLG